MIKTVKLNYRGTALLVEGIYTARVPSTRFDPSESAAFEITKVETDPPYVNILPLIRGGDPTVELGVMALEKLTGEY